MLRAWNPALPVVFLHYNSKNYDAKKYTFENHTNSFEAEIVYYLAKAFFAANYDPKEIAILTPFLNQEFYLRKRLEKYNIKDNIITIDKSQGSEKDVIIISFCSNDSEVKLLSSIERLNVAFTRAKKKIICVGNFESLKQLKVLKDYLSLIEMNKWVLNYPVILDDERN
jgi:superfamily I DNA and/or RNA helicase